ncbi:MAG: hypothetical protein RL385_138 [Pseudomonadota bacterium]
MYLDKERTEYGLSRIAISDVNDKGKYISVSGHELGTIPVDEEDVGYDVIPVTGWPILGSTNEVQLGTHRYVRAVRICTNENDQHRLKGLLVKAAYVGEEFGEYCQEEGVADEYEQPNCDKWHNWLSCPVGEIAFGLRMNYDSDQRAYTGIDLKCAELQWSADW